ncbi:MAG: MauE/DoxX family redox-associated membrane protein [Phycisphaerales bacterium JB061]
MTRQQVDAIARRFGVPAVIAAASIVLIYTGSAKLLGPSAFAETIATHGLVPRDLTPHAAWGVIAAELSIGVSSLWLLVGKQLTKPAAIGTALIFAGFAWYAGAMVIFPPEAPTSCGCTGDFEEPADWRALTGRNSATAGVLLLTLPMTRRTTAPH